MHGLLDPSASTERWLDKPMSNGSHLASILQEFGREDQLPSNGQHRACDTCNAPSAEEEVVSILDELEDLLHLAFRAASMGSL